MRTQPTTIISMGLTMVKFKVSKEDGYLIDLIVRRAMPVVFKTNIVAAPLDVEMAITAVHCNDIKLDLERLLTFEDSSFYHDIIGIMSHIDEKTGKLTNGFLPRSYRKDI